MVQCSVIQLSVQCSSVEVKCSVVSEVFYLIVWIPVGAGDKRAIGQIGMGRQTARPHMTLYCVLLYCSTLFCIALYCTAMHCVI